MFTSITPLWSRPLALLALAAATACAAAPALAADSPQVVTETLHAFGADEGQQGRTPLLQASDGKLYGVTLGGGGTALRGTLFRMNPGGLYETVYEFSGSDTVGGQPGSGPVQGSDGALYGTTQLGGASNYGTVYRIDLNGVHTTLHSFVPTNPSAIVSDTWLAQGPDGYLYGTSRVDGEFDAGSVFRLKTDGSDYRVLHSFTTGEGGREPWGAPLVGKDGLLYGSTRFGGNNDCGTIFRVQRNGAFEVLNSMCNGGETDPAYPAADLIQDASGALYGTTEFGGAYGSGTVFRRNVDGTIDTLRSFNKRDGIGYGLTARLVRDKRGVLYGVTRFGGENKQGTAFAVKPSGRTTLLHTFAANRTDGRYPWGPLMQADDGKLYGMTSGGGQYTFYGTVYRIAPSN
ncbi:MAG TPA: choice-of-anchor tandem repeat GloVer-containing protein [Ideonella sp.]|nr:choice-of-anchor tandem repeat GloVer-containing protein [Ideonella sp.]